MVRSKIGMKQKLLSLKIAALATTLIAGIISVNTAKASTFGEKEADQSNFVAVASPYGYENYNLLIIEQIPGKQKCWSEQGQNPIIIEPLLLNFDFRGHCRRSTDSNGYSLRVDGQDYGMNYLLKIVERDGNLHLIATSRSDASEPEIIIGSSQGKHKGFTKIVLNPGWKFSKRTYRSRTLAHVYLSGNSRKIFSKTE